MVILGAKGVGKTTFIEQCFVRQKKAEIDQLYVHLITQCSMYIQADVSGPARLSRRATVILCGREVVVRFVDSPDRMQLVLATMVFLLFDVTNEVDQWVCSCDSIQYLPLSLLLALLQTAHHSPGAGPKSLPHGFESSHWDKGRPH